MSDGDYLLLGALFGYGMGHSDHYYSEPYYNRYIHPAYLRYPGYVAYGYGHVPLGRYGTYGGYRTTVINHVNVTYAAQESAAHRDPKLSTYVGGGKTYTGTTVPHSSFSGTNLTPRAPAGDGPVSPSGKKGTAPAATTGGSGQTAPRPSTPSTGGKSGYSGTSTRSGTGSGGGSRSRSR